MQPLITDFSVVSGAGESEGGASAAITPSKAHAEDPSSGWKTGSSLITPLDKSSFISLGIITVYFKLHANFTTGNFEGLR